MLRPRIAPCLLVMNGGLVKTVGFGSPKYVGDPINAVRIFNEKEVDELIVLDIDATRLGREPDYGMIRTLASECRMPLCYGGGVSTVAQIEQIVSLGVEKVAIGAAAISAPDFIRRAAAVVGRQSIVAVADVKLTSDGNYELRVINGTVATGRNPLDFVQEMQTLGAGEILLNSIDRDGRMQGYDLALAAAIRKICSLPISVIGGAGSLADIGELFAQLGTVGACAGSLFVFKGKFRAVLINYPSRPEKDEIFGRAKQ